MKALMTLFLIFSSGCQPGLDRQAKIPARGYFRSAEDVRSPPAGTVAYQQELETPGPVTHDKQLRGKERYEIFCSVCHGVSGQGNGLAIERGFPAPLPFQKRRMKPMDIYLAIRDGKGVMKGMGNRIPMQDRWAITSYVFKLSGGSGP